MTSTWMARVNNGPDDAWGFGNYHGQYAFAVMSQYPIDTKQIRTFQTFKWKEMPGEANPVIDDCNNARAPIPASRQCGDAWYDDAAWQAFPLSSKNHADVPVRIKRGNKEEVIHFLISHPHSAHLRQRGAPQRQAQPGGDRLLAGLCGRGRLHGG